MTEDFHYLGTYGLDRLNWSANQMKKKIKILWNDQGKRNFNAWIIFSDDANIVTNTRSSPLPSDDCD